MKYNIRQLTSVDIFPVAKIINKIGVSEFKNIANNKELIKFNNNKDKKALGIAVIFEFGGVILGNMDKCEYDIYKFLSSVTSVSVEQLKKDSMADIAELVITIIKKEEFKDFFKVVSKLLK